MLAPSLMMLTFAVPAGCVSEMMPANVVVPAAVPMVSVFVPRVTLEVVAVLVSEAMDWFAPAGFNVVPAMFSTELPRLAPSSIVTAERPFAVGRPFATPTFKTPRPTPAVLRMKVWPL